MCLPSATCQEPAHVDTTRDAFDIGSNYRQPVSIADVSSRRGGLVSHRTAPDLRDHGDDANLSPHNDSDNSELLWVGAGGGMPIRM